MWKSPIYLIAALAVTNILVSDEAMARWEAKTCTSLSRLRNDAGAVIAMPPLFRPIMLTKGATLSVMNNCEGNLCRLGFPFRSDPRDERFQDVYVKKVFRNKTLISRADQGCDEVEAGYGGGDQSEY